MRAIAMAVMAAWLVVLSCYDIRQRRLPNRLTLPGAAVILATAWCTWHGVPATAGAAALAGTYLLVHLIAPAGMGAGDVKLAIGLGAMAGCFGIAVWFAAELAAPLLTAVLGVAARGAMPQGPSMCLAAAGAVLLA